MNLIFFLSQSGYLVFILDTLSIQLFMFLLIFLTLLHQIVIGLFYVVTFLDTIFNLLLSASEQVLELAENHFRVIASNELA